MPHCCFNALVAPHGLRDDVQSLAWHLGSIICLRPAFLITHRRQSCRIPHCARVHFHKPRTSLQKKKKKSTSLKFSVLFMLQIRAKSSSLSAGLAAIPPIVLAIFQPHHSGLTVHFCSNTVRSLGRGAVCRFFGHSSQPAAHSRWRGNTYVNELATSDTLGWDFLIVNSAPLPN